MRTMINFKESVHMPRKVPVYSLLYKEVGNIKLEGRSRQLLERRWKEMVWFDKLLYELYWTKRSQSVLLRPLFCVSICIGKKRIFHLMVFWTPQTHNVKDFVDFVDKGCYFKIPYERKTVAHYDFICLDQQKKKGRILATERQLDVGFLQNHTELSNIYQAECIITLHTLIIWFRPQAFAKVFSRWITGS